MGRKANPNYSVICETFRVETALTVNTKDIQRYEKNELLALQSRLGLGDIWGVIQIPESWLPPGVCSTKGTRVLDIRREIQSELTNEAAVDIGILTITRYTLICFLVPVMSSRAGATLLAPTTISSCIKHLYEFVKIALQKPNASKAGLFSRLDVDDLRFKGFGPKHLTELNRMLYFRFQGYWSDMPNLIDPRAFKHNNQTQQSDAGNAEDAKEVGQPSPEPFLPFSDAFVGESGWRMAWIVEHLGPILIPCAEGLANLYENLGPMTKNKHAFESKRSHAAIRYLSSCAWTDPNGHELTDLPFRISIKVRGKGPDFCWPPKTHAELKGLLVLLQTAHLYIFLMSTGGRISEALSLQEGSVIESSDGTATIAGRTYKLVAMRGGEWRTWPLPSLGILAIHQQERLSKICDAINLNGGIDVFEHDGDRRSKEDILLDDELEIDPSITSSIWRRVGTGKRILSDYNNMLASAIDVLGLTELSDGVNPHAHRFRKTVARLLALALADAPKLVMDLFGHKTIEMTLHYMLTDPLIRAEMQVVLKAQTIMLAVNAIETIDDCGGPAAARVKEAIEETKVRLGGEFGAKDIKDLAEIFTLSSKYWSLVRPGVVCTKLPQQAGACNKQVGMPETSRCRTQCDFRLEQAALRDDVDRSIEQAFQFLEEAVLERDEISAEMWRGQVYTNIDRFPSLRQKWETKLAEFQQLPTFASVP